MRALAVRPGIKHSAHIADLPEPHSSIRFPTTGVLVRTLQVGVDATDMEINEALYGRAPKGSTSWSSVMKCSALSKRRPCGYPCEAGRLLHLHRSPPRADAVRLVGRNDVTANEEYYERGIILRHGFMTSAGR